MSAMMERCWLSSRLSKAGKSGKQKWPSTDSAGCKMAVRLALLAIAFGVIVRTALAIPPSTPEMARHDSKSAVDLECRARLAHAGRAVNVLLYVPLDRTCDATCLLEIETLEALRAQGLGEALQVFVILSRT